MESVLLSVHLIRKSIKQAIGGIWIGIVRFLPSYLVIPLNDFVFIVVPESKRVDVPWELV